MGLDMYLNADGKELGYWCKANAVHNWFVQNVQNGVDECQETEVSREQLQELQNLCGDVIAHCKLVTGNVYVGSKSVAGGPFVKQYSPGLIVEDPMYAHEKLPCVKGCFFGGDDYDEYYIQKLEATVAHCKRALKVPNTTKFTYRSSW